MSGFPDYYLRRPEGPTATDVVAFERLYADHCETGGSIDYKLPAPKWQFLCWLTENHDLLLHGSSRSDIEEFEPRKAEDTSEFASNPAVFAASDGIWAMFFAILDRSVAWSLVNACFDIVGEASETGGEVARYYFSVNAEALQAQRGFSDGTVYVLPRATFEREPEDEWYGFVVSSHQWASAVPVRPLASIAVRASDFPFLADINGHDYATLVARATADPDGYPWRD